jgi:excisionase family DNA binding protein
MKADDGAEGTPVRRTYSVDEAAQLLGVSRTAAFGAVRRGEIPGIRVGKRRLVLREALDRMLAGEVA